MMKETYLSALETAMIKANLIEDLWGSKNAKELCELVLTDEQGTTLPDWGHRELLDLWMETNNLLQPLDISLEKQSFKPSDISPLGLKTTLYAMSEVWGRRMAALGVGNLAKRMASSVPLGGPGITWEKAAEQYQNWKGTTEATTGIPGPFDYADERLALFLPCYRKTISAGV